MSDIGWYFTNPSTETVHIVPEGAWAFHHKTFCGRALEGMVAGDETITGITATCESCKINFKKSKEQSS